MATILKPDKAAWYAERAVGLAREMSARRPDEPDYRRAIGRALLVLAGIHPPSHAADEAVAIFTAPVAENPLPWRIAEAEKVRLGASGSGRQGASPPRMCVGV